MKKPTVTKKIKEIFNLNRKEILFVILLLVVAAFFRFWHLGQTQFLTYDQSRDYLIIKRILIDHKLTLVGPTVLIPGVYLPPLYYYLLSPFLMLFQFHPLGGDIFTALLGLGAVFIFYLLAREIFDKRAAFLAGFVFAVLPVVVVTARHAWNPNTSLFWSMLMIFFIFNFLKKKKWLWFYAACLVFGLSLNFHFSLLPLFFLLVLAFFLVFKKKDNFFYKLIISLFCLLVFISPLAFFEIRHHFSISSNIISFLFLNNQDNDSLLSFSRLGWFFKDIFRMPFFLFNGHLISGIESVNPSSIVLLDKLSLFKENSSAWEIFYQIFNFIIVSLMLITTIISLIFKKLIKEKIGFYLILAWFILGLSLRMILPATSFYYYQYNFMFPVVLLLLANLFYVFSKKKIGLFFSLIIVFLIVAFSFFDFFKTPESVRGENLFQPTVRIIADDFYDSGFSNYAIAANNADPQRWDHNGLEYRYFLEAYFKLPISNWDVGDYQQAEVLYLIDEGDLKEPLKLKGMEMTSFAPQKIDKIWQAESGQTVYKMSK